jgi:predicted acetyltransferase
MSDVTVTVAGEGERPVLDNLMQLYFHDFSDFWRGHDDGELDANGRFADYPFLAAYWRESGRVPLLVRKAGHVAGFALVNDASHSGAPVDHNVAEFFIVRRHRRGGAGAAAAQAIFTRFPGQWEAAVMRANVGALAFWRHAVRGHPQARDVEELDLDNALWNGPILRFSIAALGAGG